VAKKTSPRQAKCFTRCRGGALRGLRYSKPVYPNSSAARKRAAKTPSPAPCQAPDLDPGLTEGIAYRLANCWHRCPATALSASWCRARGASRSTIDCAEPDKAQTGMEDWLRCRLGQPCGGGGSSVARITVRTKNAPGSLASVATVIGNNSGNISNFQRSRGAIPCSSNSPWISRCVDVAHLQNILGALRVNEAV